MALQAGGRQHGVKIYGIVGKNSVYGTLCIMLTFVTPINTYRYLYIQCVGKCELG